MTQGKKVLVLETGMIPVISKLTNTRADVVDHPLWVSKYLVQDPDVLVQMTREVIRNGADIVRSVTYQANVEGIMKAFNFNKAQAVEVIKKSVEVAKEAIRKEESAQGKKLNVLVTGSIGSYGASQQDGSEYTGYSQPMERDHLREWHRPRFEALLSSGVDLMSFETIPCVTEALALLDLVKEHPGLRAWVSFSIKDERSTAGGEEYSEAVARVWAESNGQLLGIGANCFNKDWAASLLKAARARLPTTPFVLYTNMSSIYDPASNSYVQSKGSTPLEQYIEEWLELGVTVLGGCCGSTPEDLKLIASFVRKWNAQHKLI